MSSALALVVGLIFLPLAVVAAVAFWRARRLCADGPCRRRRYVANALGVGLLPPAALLAWHAFELATQYAPDRCGSWWLGASEAECTLSFYLASRLLAALVFLIGPAAVLCLAVSCGVFWLVRTRRDRRCAQESDGGRPRGRSRLRGSALQPPRVG